MHVTEHALCANCGSGELVFVNVNNASGTCEAFVKLLHDVGDHREREIEVKAPHNWESFYRADVANVVNQIKFTIAYVQIVPYTLKRG